MILFTIKKATAIYRLIVSFIFIILSFSTFASVDLVSYCFAPSTNLKEAEISLSFLLLPKEKVFPRPDQNCFDIMTSANRSNLLEKFLSKSYTLINERSKSLSENIQAEQCQIELKTTKKVDINTKNFRLGLSKVSSAGSDATQEVSISQLLLGFGRPGTLELEGKSLYIECRKMNSGIYQLIFSYNEALRTKVKSEISLRRGEALQVAQITNDLDTQSTTLGLPQTLYQSTQGQENINYELKIN